MNICENCKIKFVPKYEKQKYCSLFCHLAESAKQLQQKSTLKKNKYFYKKRKK